MGKQFVTIVGIILILLTVGLSGCTNSGTTTSQKDNEIQAAVNAIRGNWSVTITSPDGNSTVSKMRFRIEGDALVYCTYHPEFGNWSGYGYLGTLQHDAFVYNTTGEQLIQSDTDGECTCKADVFSHKEWVFVGDHLIGRIIETKKLLLGTKDTCPDWVWTLLPSTATTTWDGYRI